MAAGERNSEMTNTSLDFWMNDTSLDFFLETSSKLDSLIDDLETNSSKLDPIIDEKDLQSLKEEMKHLRRFFKVAEKKRNGHSEMMKLVMEIGGVVSEAGNDIVYQLQSGIFKRRDSKKRKQIIHDYPNKRKIKTHEIKTLTAKVKQIYGENICDLDGAADKNFKHSSTISGGGLDSSGGCNTSKVVKEKVVVGFADEVETLLEKLDDRREGRPLEIITIIGAGGGGKTTLAREVFDHAYTKYHFDIRVWVHVSQKYDKTTKKDLLIRVLKSAFPENHEDHKNSSEDILGEKVLRCLKGRKYLIVMDDIWDIEAWNDVQRSYPNERKGSKVLFTSRQLVQLDSIHCVPHYLAPLPKCWSWELLQKKVFGMNCCPPELVEIGVKIAEKCDGLPLAIVAIAGILATKDKTLNVWEEVAKHLSSIIAQNNEAGCMEILELSYNHLPLHLKTCFLYIGAFLEDSKIRVRELLWLWIAEGFIQQSEEGKSLEAVARDHLIDLIGRSLVMVAQKSSLGGIKACRVHDLLRVFCLKKAEEENFSVQIYKDYLFSPFRRRLFLGHNQFELFRSNLEKRFENIQSFLCLHLPNSSYSAFEEDLSFFKTFESLRVFSFVSAVCRIEMDIRNLVRLRYLAIRLPRQERFFASPLISNLSNLETLDLQGPETLDSIQLPCDIFKMVKLRHLYSKYGVFEYHFSSEDATRIGFDHFSKLHSLQTLHRMCACKDCRSFLVRTPNLRKLGLQGTFRERFTILDLEFLKCLETLNLALVTLMAGLKLPLTIKRLTLFGTCLKWEELSILQNLPKLEVLKFKGNACEGPIWNTSGEGFSQLKYLSFNNMSEIEEWNASEDQFPKLEVLVLEYCRKLKRIPIDFSYLNDLREIKLIGGTQSARESAREILEAQRNKMGDDDCLNHLADDCQNLLAKNNHFRRNDDECDYYDDSDNNESELGDIPEEEGDDDESELADVTAEEGDDDCLHTTDNCSLWDDDERK